jgi:multidrug resistance efflux pump
MRKIDFYVLLIGIFVAASWVIFSGMNGFKASGASMIARSINVISTIEGQVVNNPPRAGESVSADTLLVRIRDDRIDKSKLTEHESQIALLRAEIESVNGQQEFLKAELQRFRQRADEFSAWLEDEIEIKQTENAAELEIAQSRYTLNDQKVARLSSLHEKGLTTEESIQTAIAEAQIARNELRITEAQLRRNAILRDMLKDELVFFESGDASYWDKMIDTLSLRIFDNNTLISTLRLQLARAELQAQVERSRVESSFAEEHRAPFDGVINASFVTRDTRVTSGSDLYQILDCSNPIIIVPVPDNRLSEFSVGLRVTVYPTDTDEALGGTISYVTSGALIDSDTSIQIQEYLIMQGNRAIVALDQQESADGRRRSCEAERKAVVMIHTTTWFNRLFGWGEEKQKALASLN